MMEEEEEEKEEEEEEEEFITSDTWRSGEAQQVQQE